MKKFKTNWESIGDWTYIVSFWCIVIIIVGLALTGCTTPKTIEQHHHHYEQADTLAIQAQIDHAVNSWHEQMDSSLRQTWQEYTTSMTNNEDQKEHITETITTYIDSLGREVRQEQRTIDRSLSKMQQQTEQRLSREFEQRVSVVVDSVNDIWQQRFNAVKTHWEQSDSTYIKEVPVTNSELPWYKRWWYTLQGYLLIVAVGILLLLTRRIWWPWCKILFRKIFTTFTTIK